MRTFKPGTVIYHGSRYWKSEGLESGEVLGWNTKYIPYKITKITAKRVWVAPPDRGFAMFLNRATMERDGKQYHTRFHEYFYAEKPAPESKDFNWMGSKPVFSGAALTTLGLSLPCTKEDVRRAYKRLAKNAHPDRGGSHQAFIKLREAHDSALRFATDSN